MIKKIRNSKPLIGAQALVRHLVFFSIQEKKFLMLLVAGFLVAGIAQYSVPLGMAVGFVFASYPVVANDSIQTIGTFIASNKEVKWWIKWLFIAGIFAATILYSWYMFGGDVSFERLTTKGFEDAPTSFHYLQLAAPLFLLILTRFKIPVSTSLLILTAFATTPSVIGKVISKSLTGYVIAFVGAMILWGLVTRIMEKATAKPAGKHWRAIQWLTTGVLWSFWWQQDAANIAVYLPRSLSLGQVLAFIGVIAFGLALMFKANGEKIQEIVDKKSNVVDVRSATLIDAFYALILWYFKIQSKVPMSTTWVFLGLLGGRELMINIRSKLAHKQGVKSAFKTIGVEAGGAFIGLAVSLLIGASINGLNW